MSPTIRNLSLLLIVVNLFFACNPELKSQIKTIIEKTFTKNENIDQIFHIVGTKKLEESKKNVPLDKLIAKLHKKLESEETERFFEAVYTKRYTPSEIAQITALVENPMFERYSEDVIEITKEGLAHVSVLLEEILKQTSSNSENLPSEVIEIDTNNFEAQVLDSPIPVVLDFYADWCAPCKTIDLMLRELSGEFGGKVRFARLNTATEKEIADRFQISDLPVVLFIREGKIIERQKGFATKEVLREKILSITKD